MAKSLAFLTTALLGTVATLACLPAQAQTPTLGNSIAGPDYGEDGNYRTPTADGRPAIYYFDLGAKAFRTGDFRHAVDMYKVAASWAYKPAEYNLGLMYFKGQGVPVDRARGTAWMILAAERNTPLYVKARDLMVTMLTKAEFQRTDEIWNQLKPVYGDTVPCGVPRRSGFGPGGHRPAAISAMAPAIFLSVRLLAARRLPQRRRGAEASRTSPVRCWWAEAPRTVGWLTVNSTRATTLIVRSI